MAELRIDNRTPEQYEIVDSILTLSRLLDRDHLEDLISALYRELDKAA
jgi:hypothetical protein